MKKNIRAFAQSLNIEYTGFTQTQDGQTAIVFLFPYFWKHYPESNLSIYTYGTDYHQVIHQYLSQIADFLHQKFPGHYYRPYADISPYDERQLAVQAGLGVLGKNHLLINETYGSFVFIGILVTNLPLSPDSPSCGSCIGCDKCLVSCPTGALKDGDFSRCLSHITQKKGALTPEEEALVKEGGLVFGCDQCQLCCPHNLRSKTPIPEFQTHQPECLHILDLLDLSNREFQRKYNNRAFSWRGKNVLIRNLTILGQ